jgi:MerR family mercuric resistance operon transcriptional regulator
MKLLKIGQVAKASGVGIEALRFYERSGLLGRPSRTQSGYRLYDAEILARLDFIKRAQVLGFSLQEIKQIITDKLAGRSPCREVREIVRQRLDELDDKMQHQLGSSAKRKKASR